MGGIEPGQSPDYEPGAFPLCYIALFFSSYHGAIFFPVGVPLEALPSRFHLDHSFHQPVETSTMHGLALCSRVLYDQQILDDQKHIERLEKR